MASRPEAAYAATEVTPKWVLISWHHLLPPSLIITANHTRTQCPVRVLGVTDANNFRRRPGRPGGSPGNAGPLRRTERANPRGHALLRPRHRRRLLLYGLGRRGRRARHPARPRPDGCRPARRLSRVRRRYRLRLQS